MRTACGDYMGRNIRGKAALYGTKMGKDRKNITSNHFIALPSLVIIKSSILCHPERSEGPMQLRAAKIYFVYIMTNRSKTLYTGVTNNLVRRVRQHKTTNDPSFTHQYKIDRLVYFERFEDVRNAIEREKQIKGWLRRKKINLIVSVNPEWRDLSLGWEEHHKFEPDRDVRPDELYERNCIGPSLRSG
jgi:putative endonuclease